MKKATAWGLVLVLLLLLLPCASAQTQKVVSDKSYTLKARTVYMYEGIKYDVLKDRTETERKQNVNTIELKYDYETETAVKTGRFTEDKKIALIAVGGWDEEIAAIADPKQLIITINGRLLDTELGADYDDKIGWVNYFKELTEPYQLVFPLALTEEGGIYSFDVEITGLSGNTWVTERAKISVKLVNTHEYKDEKKLTITDLSATGMDAYIVGEKIYLDHWKNYVPKAGETVGELTLTLGDENGAAFNRIAYFSNPFIQKDADGNALKPFVYPFGVKDEANGTVGVGECEVKIKDSKVTLHTELLNSYKGDELKNVTFAVETKLYNYAAEYDFVVRRDVEYADPKGIYFAENERAIAIGETYTPVVMGVKTAARVKDVALHPGDNTDAEVIDIVDDVSVIGTREGVAYITATHTTRDGKVYDASSMRITVAGVKPNATIPQEKTAEYRVICRNLNVRAGAGTDADKARMAHRGEVLYVLDIANGWAKLNDGTFVSEKYIELVK